MAESRLSLHALCRSYQSVRLLNKLLKCNICWKFACSEYIHVCFLCSPVQDQYAFCYRAALEYLSSFDHYAS